MKRLLFVLLMLAGPVLALDPSEMLQDPVLEARARALDHELRCVKCQSEAIASSNADWAKDARRMVRELITEGLTDEEVRAWFQARYGDFVLMEPPHTGTNLILWWAGPGLLLLGLGAAWLTVRSRARGREVDMLDAEEEARLSELLNK